MLAPCKPHPHPQLGCTAQQSRLIAAAAASTAGIPLPPDAAPSPIKALIQQYTKFYSLAGKFMPMVGLFSMLAFVNTILDSLKDTLVITAVGGGAQVGAACVGWSMVKRVLFMREIMWHPGCGCCMHCMFIRIYMM